MNTKIFTKVVAAFLALCLGFNLTFPEEAPLLQIRTLDLSSLEVSDCISEKFESSNVSYDENTNKVCFTGQNAYSDLYGVMFDNVSFEESDTDNSELNVEGEMAYIPEDNEDAGAESESLDEDMGTVEYECSFDMEKLEYYFVARLIDAEGNVVDTEEINTEAIITESGGLDACIEIDGQSYMMSDYTEEETVDNCSFMTIIYALKIIAAYVAVSEAAEIIKAQSNYTYNKQLEANNNGVGYRCYVTNQSDVVTQNKKAGNYKFGFTTFSGVGCEVAAAYNLMISIGKPERLSETIYCFETWLIEFSVGWGKLGSNPMDIYRYLSRRGINYKMYTNLRELEMAAGVKGKCYIIMSRWNKNMYKTGLHTFFVRRLGNQNFQAYNWKYRTSYEFGDSLSTFNDGSGFIVGYLIWK